MKKIILFVLAGAMLCSCQKNSVTKEEVFENFEVSMFSTMICDPICALLQLKEEKKDIFAKSFTDTVKIDDGNMFIKKDTTKIDTWSIHGKYSKKEYNSSVKYLGPDKNGLSTWSSTCTGSYDEGNGYSAVLKDIDSTKFYWQKISSYISVIYNVVCDTKFTIETRKDGVKIETRTYEYKGKDADTDTSYGFSYE